MAGPSEKLFRATVLARRGLAESSLIFSIGRSSARTWMRAPARTNSSTCSTAPPRERGGAISFSRLAIEFRFLHAYVFHQVVQCLRVVTQDSLGLQVGLKRLQAGGLHLSDPAGESLDLAQLQRFHGRVGPLENLLRCLETTGLEHLGGALVLQDLR